MRASAQGRKRNFTGGDENNAGFPLNVQKKDQYNRKMKPIQRVLGPIVIGKDLRPVTKRGHHLFKVSIPRVLLIRVFISSFTGGSLFGLAYRAHRQDTGRYPNSQKAFQER
jgi:hypothetical protein